jgi:hypothetical protein
MPEHSPNEIDSDDYISLIKPPGYDIPGKTPQITIRTWQSHTSILERTRSLTHAIASGSDVIELVSQAFLEAAVEAKIGDLLPLVGEAIGDRRVGFLLRVNLFRDPVGGQLRASPNLISVLRIGFEPVDALADSYIIGGTDSQPTTVSSVRRYIWCTRKEETLNITCISETGPNLEAQARREAQRRWILGSATVSDHGHIMRMERAEHWKKVYQQRARELDTEESRRRFDSLTRAFSASQERFNAAYHAYHAAERELASAQREQKVLSSVATMLTLLSAGYEFASTGSNNSTDDPQAALRWRDHQVTTLQQAVEHSGTTLNESLHSLKTLETNLREEWLRRRVETDDVNWIPSITPPH